MVLAAAQKQAELNAALARAFAALSDPTRCAVVELLRERPQRASDLAAALDIAPAGLSRHLRQLERSGLVAADAVEHDARVRLYRLEPHVFASLSDWAAAMHDEWHQQLQAFKAHAERAVAAPSAAPRRRAGR
ncbi:MAG TPA: metalloregulator ArsR/SmtB family transcription factor [Burkholderiaceae bacterium]|nr:metalloregulator ArsR/SmtB family transcription factor [Burkholderiaceae bacterium]